MQPENQYSEPPQNEETDQLIDLPKNQDYGTISEYLQPSGVNKYIRSGFVKKVSFANVY